MSLRRLSSKFRLQSLENRLLDHLAHLSQDSKYQLKHQKLIIFGKDVLKDLSHHSIPIHRLGITQTDSTTENEIRTILEEIQSDKYYLTTSAQTKKLTSETHKPNPKEVWGEVDLPEVTRFNPEVHLNQFSLTDTLLFSSHISLGTMASLIRTGLGLGWRNILVPIDFNVLDPISLRCSKSSLFFTNIYSYCHNDLKLLQSFGLNFQIDTTNVHQINEDIKGIKHRLKTKSDFQPKLICFQSNSNTLLNDQVLDPLVSGSLILSKMRQL